MALINCPECGKEISEKAKSCPNCGCPIDTSEPEKADNTSDYVVIHGYEETFAELGVEVKNRISHRARAVAKLVDFLGHQPV